MNAMLQIVTAVTADLTDAELAGINQIVQTQADPRHTAGYAKARPVHRGRWVTAPGRPTSPGRRYALQTHATVMVSGIDQVNRSNLQLMTLYPHDR
jgi:hypothetical protein